jgi:hypothetical protein
VGCEKQRLPPPLALPGTGDVAQPSRAGLPPQWRMAWARAFFLGTRIQEAPNAPLVGAGAAPPPNPPPRPPSSGSHRLPNTLGQVGEQYGPSVAPFARARCPFSPLLRPYSPGGAVYGPLTGQFPCFVFRTPRSCFIAPVLDIRDSWTYLTGFLPLGRPLGLGGAIFPYTRYARQSLATTRS